MCVVRDLGKVEGHDARRDETHAHVVPQAVPLLREHHPEEHHRYYLVHRRQDSTQKNMVGLWLGGALFSWEMCSFTIFAKQRGQKA